MPQKNREAEIHRAIRKYLGSAVCKPETITDERLMAAAGCARATYYKYVIKGSMIEAEIANARCEQKKYVQVSNGLEPSVSEEKSNSEMREALAREIEGNRNLIGHLARFTSNLIERGVPVSIIQEAEQNAMTKPDRSASHAGNPRSKVLRRR